MIHMIIRRISEDEDGLLNAKIVYGYAQKSALSNKNGVLPEQEEIEQKTLDEEPEMKEGCLTQELSDVTEIEENVASSSVSFSYYLYKIAKISENELPCMYQWSGWSACSETCMSTSEMPLRSRRVLKKSIVRSRGKFPPCPENLAAMVERMPCNIYRCPVNLSSITGWTQCYYKNPSEGESGGCYRIRDIPTVNQLIYIDTTNVMEDCKCLTAIF
uniref:TSP1_CCN domain-containing protein n=1 Tax=Loa loa TaxID=7209 RepID=A0A1I7VUY5_LOALO